MASGRDCLCPASVPSAFPQGSWPRLFRPLCTFLQAWRFVKIISWWKLEGCWPALCGGGGRPPTGHPYASGGSRDGKGEGSLFWGSGRGHSLTPTESPGPPRAPRLGNRLTTGQERGHAKTAWPLPQTRWPSLWTRVRIPGQLVPNHVAGDSNSPGSEAPLSPPATSHSPRGKRRRWRRSPARVAHGSARRSWCTLAAR